MKTPIKIMKRKDRNVTHDVAISSTRTKRQRTTEVIVKSWIIESRERRRADLNRLQNAVRSKGLKGSRVVRKFESPGVNLREETKAALSDANDIARAQLVRFRRRLGRLTRDQELQIENLLISTVTKISLVTGRVMEALAESSPTKLSG